MIAAASTFFACFFAFSSLAGVSEMRMIRDRLIACILVCCLAFAASPALAQSFDDALAKFAADSFSDTEAGINAVATSGNPLAV